MVRVECNGLHAVVISRFLYDCTYFGKEVMAMIEAVTGTAKSQPPKPDLPGYKSIFEVTLSQASRTFNCKLSSFKLLPHIDLLMSPE